MVSAALFNQSYPVLVMCSLLGGRLGRVLPKAIGPWAQQGPHKVRWAGMYRAVLN